MSEGDDRRYLPGYMEFSQERLLWMLAEGPLKRTDGRIPTRLYLDGDKVLIRFETPITRVAS
jgi:hypothetical protein